MADLSAIGLDVGGANAAPSSAGPTIKDIKRQVCISFQVSEEELTSASRERQRSIARRVACYLCVSCTDRSLAVIGQRLGYSDHSTVLVNYRRIKAQLEIDDELKSHVSLVTDALGVTPQIRGRKCRV